MIVTLRTITAGLRALFRRPDVENEVDEEIAHYLEQATKANIRSGMSPVEAERAARAAMGSATSVREQALSGLWEAGIESTLSDIGYGWRTLLKNPGFTIAAVLTIALGIGANTAMFSVVNAVMFRPLPWRDAGTLALIWTNDIERGLPREATAYGTVTDWKTSNRTFSDIAYFMTQRVATISSTPGAERGRSRSALVSENLFGVLGVAPTMGRAINQADLTERLAVGVISHSFWQRWFGGAPDVVGKTVTVDDGSKGGPAAVTVIGVMPPGFYFPDRTTEIWSPATTYWRFDRESSERFQDWARRWTAVGRLSPGNSMSDAQADLDRVGRYLGSVHTTALPGFPGFNTTVLSVLDSITGQNLQATLWILLGAVGLVLLVACVNVANLLLARGSARQREFAVRRALGAGRSRLVRQLVTESLMLSLAGGVLGILVAGWGTSVLGITASGFVPRIDEIATDWRVLAFGLGASVVAGLMFGLAPALRLSRADASETLQEGVRSTGHSDVRRSRNALVMAEIALALTLLTGAGLLLRSLQQLQSVNPGFDPTRLLTVRIEFPTEAPPTAAERLQPELMAPNRARARVARANEIQERVGALPGVTSVGFSDDLFVQGQGNASIFIPGRSTDETPPGELNEGAVTPDFFPTMRATIRSGRALNDADAEQKIRALWGLVPTDLPLAEKERRAIPEPVVVNEAFVRRFFPNEDPLGRKFGIDPLQKTYFYQIVGVVADMHRSGLERRAMPEFYGPWLPSGGNARADLLVRTTADPLALASTVRQVVANTVPGITVVSVATADKLLGDFSALRRLQTWLLTIFAALALVLAAIGIFGVVHYTVAERTREIGVRVALGARPGSVLRLILGQGMRPVLIGIVAGVVTSLAVTRVLSSLLFEVGATDPLTFAAVALILLAVAVAACWIAGRRALRVDPVSALRHT